jgi:hypothetical protein
MQGSIIVQLVVTGIVAIVPSAKDVNVTRLIAPKHMEISAHHFPPIPEHFAFVEVHSKNLAPGGPKGSFRYHFNDDKPYDDRVVFIVNSAEVKFGNSPSNQTLIRNAIMPKNGLGAPKGDMEETSTAYELQLTELCPWCKSIHNDYFNLAAHPDKVALRMDLIGGTESVRVPDLREVWQAEGSTIKQPLAQKVVFEYVIPGSGQQLIVSEIPLPGDPPQDTTIGLLQDPDGEPIEVIVGNAPLLSILRLDANFKGAHHDDHFALFYDMFTPSPQTRPVLHLVPGGSNISGPKDNCIPPHTRAQDPTL